MKITKSKKKMTIMWRLGYATYLEMTQHNIHQHPSILCITLMQWLINLESILCILQSLLKITALKLQLQYPLGLQLSFYNDMYCTIIQHMNENERLNERDLV